MTPFAERFFDARKVDVEAGAGAGVGAGSDDARADGAGEAGSVCPDAPADGGTPIVTCGACLCTPGIGQQVRAEKEHLYKRNREMHDRAQRAEVENARLENQLARFRGLLFASEEWRLCLPTNRELTREEYELLKAVNLAYGRNQ